jgi:hypothetical protein
MSLRALSERVKRQISRQIVNMQLEDAVNEYTLEQDKPKSERRGLRPIAAKHGIKYKTLHDQVNGGRTLSEFNVLKRKLTPAEEAVLVDFIIQSADLALPLSVSNIRTHANEILKGRDTPGDVVGEHWVGRFLDWHRDKLQTHWSSPLATERAKSLNPEAVKCWFALVKERVSAWKSGCETENRPRPDWTVTARNRKYCGPIETETAVRSMVSQHLEEKKTAQKPIGPVLTGLLVLEVLHMAR